MKIIVEFGDELEILASKSLCARRVDPLELIEKLGRRRKGNAASRLPL